MSGDLLQRLVRAREDVGEVRPFDLELHPARLLFGAGAIERLGEVTRALGGRRALLVTDAGLVRVGHVARALTALAGTDVEHAVYAGVEENPTTRHVREGVAIAREHEVDLIIGLGGGSAMDCAKGINFLLAGGGRMEDYWGTGKATGTMLPSVAVPTTAGTGSDAQSYALISQEETHVKMACGDKKAQFRAVILDPDLARTVPRAVAAATGLDAISHVLESYVSTRRNAVSQMLGREAWQLLESSFPSVIRAPGDLAAWGPMLLGAHLAGAAIEHSMLGAAHAAANPLTARFGVTHGIAVALMLPHVMTFNAAAVGRLYEELQSTQAGGLRERVCELRDAAGLPRRLRDVSIDRGALGGLAEDAERQWTAEFNPRPVGRAELLELYEAAY